MTLRRPIKDYLVRPVDGPSVARSRAAVATGRRAGRSPTRAWAMLAIAAAIAAGLLLWRAGEGTPGERNAPLTVGAQPLAVIDADRPRTIRLDDGSSIAVVAGTRVVPRSNDGREVVLELERGTITLDVVPGGPRRWLIEAQWATVEVTGTHFVVARDHDGVEVSVQRGEVVVRGEHVVGRERHLVAGQRLRVDAPVEAALVAPVRTAPSHDAVAEDEAEATLRDRRPRVAAEPVPAAPVASDEIVAELLDAADSARTEGRPHDAAELLATIVRDHPSDPRASVAAFTLARLDLDVLRDPAAAKEMLERALALGLPLGMREDARARPVEALARMGRPDEARVAAAQFEAELPDSPRLQEVRRWARVDEH